MNKTFTAAELAEKLGKPESWIRHQIQLKPRQRWWQRLLRFLGFAT